MNPSTASEGLCMAFQATLNGDYALRDRLCERTRRLIEAEDHAARVQRVLSVNFYIDAKGTVYPTVLLARAAGEIH
jgi:hypothetical protein